MAVVNRVPRGLLGLLDAKTQGQTPSDTTGVLSPVIDLTPNYLADIPFDVGQASDISNTVGLNLGVVTVPAGELWYVYAISSEQISAGAGTSGAIATVLNVPTAALSMVLATSFAPSVVPYGAGNSNAAFVNFPNPILLGPGAQIASRVIVPVGGGSPNNLTSVLYRSVSV